MGQQPALPYLASRFSYSFEHFASEAFQLDSTETQSERSSFRHVIASNPLSNLKFKGCNFLLSSLLFIFSTCSSSISLTFVLCELILGLVILGRRDRNCMEEIGRYVGPENKCRFHNLRIVGCPLEIPSWLSGKSGPDLSHLCTLVL